MGTQKRLSVLLTVGLVTILTGTAVAQQWDPNRYLELLDDGNRIYERAQELGPNNPRYNQMVYDTLALKQEALEMLRRAVLAREVPEYLMNDARTDLFNLNENVMFLLMEIDQCAAAELLLDRSAMDTEILPEGGLEHLGRLRGDLDVCYEGVASAEAATWDIEEYLQMIEEAETWRAQADAATEPIARNAALFESSQDYGRALDYLRQGMMHGLVDEITGLTSADLFDLYETLIMNFLEMNLCPSAERRLEQAISDSNMLAEGDPGRFEAYQLDIQECWDRAAQGIGPVTPQPRPGVQPGVARQQAPPLPERMEYGIASYVLLGVCGVSAITALGLDLATGSDRDELETLRDQCNAGSCDYARSLELSDGINDRKALIGVLSGVSVVTGVVGLVMLVLDLTAEPALPAATGQGRGAGPEAFLGFDQVGVRFRF
ncbi:MAG: hypothetical protein JW797_04935 [Bradymonadales bacterium]|nr:hypothetical protein [Bradymonadales bacterium]